MQAFVLWLSVAAGCGLLFTAATRNAGYLALAGSAFGLLLHYDLATVPEVLYLAVLFWVAAALLLVGRLRAGRLGRTA